MAEKQQLIEIVHQLKNGDKEAAAVLYEAYYRDLHYYILRRVTDPENAESLTNDSFIEIFNSIATLSKTDDFLDWSLQIAARRCDAYNEARRKSLSEIVGSDVIAAVAEERREIHPDESEEKERAISSRPETRSGIKIIESVARKVIVGVVAALILAMIRNSGMNWMHTGSIVESEGTEFTETGENEDWTGTIIEGGNVELPETEGTEATTEEDESGKTDETAGENESASVGVNTGGNESENPEESMGADGETENQNSAAEETQQNMTEAEMTEPDVTAAEPTAPPETERTEPPVAETEPAEMVELTLTNSYWGVVGIGTCTGTDIVIPGNYEGLPVEYIANYAFLSCTYLRHVTLPDGIYSIRGSAFASCNNLESINLPKALIQLGGYAFSGCSSLKSIEIPSNLPGINEYTFFGCESLTGLVIPDNIAVIGHCAFGACNSLTEITIPAGTTSMNGGAFYKCMNLENITVDAGNPVYYSTDNCMITKASKKLVLCSNRSIIPTDGSITAIGDYACTSCGAWTELTIPEGVTSIGINAFEFLNLTKISIPASVTSIGECAFKANSKLTAIYYAGTMDQWKSIEKGKDWNMSAGHYTIYCTDGELPMKIEGY